MLKPVKISHPENDVWAVSDLHYSHNRDFLWGKRGFANVEEHDQTVVQRWNSFLTNRSVCLHLGDIIFNDPDGDKLKALLRRLNFGTLYMGAGNHISGHLALYKEAIVAKFANSVVNDRLEFEVYPLEYHVDGNPHKKVIFMPAHFEASVGGQRLFCFHYPTLSFNKQSKGAIHLCGHSHGSCELSNKDTGLGYRLDVGIESFGRPVSLTEIKAHLRGRSLDIRDHHDGSEAGH